MFYVQYNMSLVKALFFFRFFTANANPTWKRLFCISYRFIANLTLTLFFIRLENQSIN